MGIFLGNLRGEEDGLHLDIPDITIKVRILFMLRLSLMKTIKLSENRKIMFAALVLAVSGALISVFVFWQNGRQGSVATESIPKPFFSFDEAKSPGWWSGGNNWQDIHDYTGDQITEAELPIADISVLQGTRQTPGNCFVTAFYQKGVVDIATALKEREDEMISADEDSSSLKQVGTVQQTILTPDGIKEYTVYQYDMDVPDVQRGNEFGFIPLDDGYVEVRGVCLTADLLPQTIPTLSAIKLNPKK